MTTDELNQTQFISEDQIFSSSNVAIPDPVIEEKKEPEKKSNKKKILFIVLGVVFLLLFSLVMLLKMRKKPVKQEDEVVNQKVSEELTPMQQRIESLREDLEVADPTNQDLTFPPVDMGLRLDKVER